VPKEENWRGYYCCVPGCKNSTSQRAERESLGLPKISFHSFPTSKAVRKEWLVKIKRANFKIKRDTKICSVHFVPDDFFVALPECPSKRPRLHNLAVPSIFPLLPRKIRKRSSVTSMKAAAPFNEYSADAEQCVDELSVDAISYSDKEEYSDGSTVVQDKMKKYRD